jgi:putative colanic acid biosynthesis acetyltransferase WcaF
MRPTRRLLQPVVRSVHLARFTWLRLRTFGRVRAASTPITAAGARVLSGTRVTLGHRVALGRHMWVETDLTVGDDVLFSGRVGVLSNVHDIDSPLTVFTAPSKPFAPVVLEGDNLVGYGALLIGPCHLERGAVLGAGAVATGRLLADTVYVGIPARPLRTRHRGPATGPDAGGVAP